MPSLCCHSPFHGVQGVIALQGKRIATSYPFLVNKWLNENSGTAEIHEISGSVEIAPGIGLADGGRPRGAADQPFS